MSEHEGRNSKEENRREALRLKMSRRPLGASGRVTLSCWESMPLDVQA